MTHGFRDGPEGDPGGPAPAAVDAPVESKRNRTQALPVQRKPTATTTTAPGAAGPGASGLDDPYGFHLPVQRKAGPAAAGPTAEDRCLTEYGAQLPDPDSPDATDRFELDGGAARYSPSFTPDGKVASIAKRFHDRFSNTSVVVMVRFRPPVTLDRATAYRLADEAAAREYRSWLAQRVATISQLCAQREEVELETQAEPATVTLGTEPDRPPGPPGQRPVEPPPATPGSTPAATVRIQFAHGSATPLGLDGALAAIRKLHGERPRATVRLDGHASSIGEDEVNARLSQRRVDAVRAALAAALPDLRVPARADEAHGEAAAQASEAGLHGDDLRRAQAHNRRVDVTFAD